MYCPNCGYEINENSKFCGYCGKPLENDLSVPKKKNTFLAKIPFILIGLIVCYGVWRGAYAAAHYFFAGHSAIAYISNNSLMLMQDIEDEEAITLTRMTNYRDSENFVHFSEDGKYVYYYSKYDTSTGTGSLCRAQVSKLRKDSNKNDKYIVRIDNNVLVSSTTFLDNAVYYQTKNKDLYYYNGKESVRIARDVEQYYVTEGDRIFYRIEEAIYVADINEIENASRIASNVDTWYGHSDDGKAILYSTLSNSGAEVAYSATEERSELLGEVGVKLSFDSKQRIWLGLIENGEMALYVWDNGTVKDLNTKFLQYGEAGNGFLYFVGEAENRVSSNATQISFPNSEEDYYGNLYFMPADSDTAIRLSDNLIDELYESERLRCFYMEKKLYVYDVFNKTLYVSAVQDGEAGTPEIISDDATNIAYDMKTNTIYYQEGAYTVDDSTYSDLYQYKNGKTTCLVKDIYESGYALYEDDVIVFATESVTSTQPGIAYVSKRGDVVSISSNVSRCARVDGSSYIYVSNSMLYRYDQDETKRIASSAEFFWISNVMDTIRLKYLK